MFRGFKLVHKIIIEKFKFSYFKARKYYFFKFITYDI